MNNLRTIPMIVGAHTLVEVNGGVAPGESVLIVTDTEMTDIAQVLGMAVLEAGAEISIVVMTPRSSHGEEPPRPVAGAMGKADIIYAPTVSSLFHTDARRNATAAGVRFCNMVDFRPWMMVKGGLQADFMAIAPVAEILSAKLTAADVVRVTTPAGTNITFNIEGREGYPQFGMARKAGQVCSPPDIEVAIAPVEGTTEGIIVVDGSIPHPSLGLVNEPIRLTIRDGRVGDITGEQQAVTLRNLWKAYHNETVYNVAELGIALNPEAHLSGAMLEDEGAYGTVHFGFGDNRSFGGHVQSPLHLDVVLRNPTVMLSDEPVVQDGEVLITDQGEHHS